MVAFNYVTWAAAERETGRRESVSTATTTLLVLMYHRAQAEQHGNAPEMLDAHFAHIAESYRQVLPGEPLADGALNVCLSFDDAYFDFYAVVFPLLRKHKLRALLAVPTGRILEQTTKSPDVRLKITSTEAFAAPASAGFCTWPELEELAHSGHVAIAAHGDTHCRLDVNDPTTHADEVERPQMRLSTRLQTSVESFVFPYGRYSQASLGYARRRYRHVFRIGGATNRGWSSRLLYRVDADAMSSPDALFSPEALTLYRRRSLWNRLRWR
jgi:peptidoglycan/xylan/chitin deacetylase (PgdA/CDA1 family)